jgi:hypothetical protein
VTRERAVTGTDLDDLVVGSGLERFDDAALRVRIDEEVLSERTLRPHVRRRG